MENIIGITDVSLLQNTATKIWFFRATVYYIQLLFK
jgi:hypothetical protein